MSQKIHLVIPMSGTGERFVKAGYKKIKPLIEINNKSIISRLLEKIPLDWPTTFILSTSQKDSELVTQLKNLRPTCHIFYIEPHKKGPGWAILQNIEQFDSKSPILVSYCDFGLIWDPWDFQRFVLDSDCDSCVVTYKGFHAHYLSPTTYAYCRMENSAVREVKEKGSFTSHRETEPASAGMYYFKNKHTLHEALKYQFTNSILHNEESYTSLTVESLLRMNTQCDVRVYNIPYFFQWGTPEDLQTYEYWERVFRTYNHKKNSDCELSLKSVQTLIPMAGLGSRFQNLTHLAKPLIPVGEKRMYEMALESLPNTSNYKFVTTEKIAKEMPVEILDHSLLLANTPQGQALTTLAGLKCLDYNKSVLISACDHMASFNNDLWHLLLKSSDIDAAIMTIRGFPGCLRKPQAYAYVETASEFKSENSTKNQLAKVCRVSVKQPISQSPQKDLLLVGTFWFKDILLLENSINELVKKGNAVNGEYYLDSVFDIYLKSEKKVVSFELESYFNLGDPDSLAEYLYWREVFLNQSLMVRPKFTNLFGQQNEK